MFDLFTQRRRAEPSPDQVWGVVVGGESEESVLFVFEAMPDQAEEIAKELADLYRESSTHWSEQYRLQSYGFYRAGTAPHPYRVYIAAAWSDEDEISTNETVQFRATPPVDPVLSTNLDYTGKRRRFSALSTDRQAAVEAVRLQLEAAGHNGGGS
jgi:hypothetical protein